jgi:hypothetical protein
MNNIQELKYAFLIEKFSAEEVEATIASLITTFPYFTHGDAINRLYLERFGGYESQS